MLDPERLRGVEAGIEYRSGGIGLSVTGFINRLSDAIANVTLGHGPGIFPGVGFVAGDFRQRQNIDSVTSRGLELSGDAHRGPWSLRLDASYRDPRVKADGPAAPLDRSRPAQTAKFVMAASLRWERENRSASVIVQHLGAQYDDDLNQRRLPSATTVGAFIAWPVARRIQLIGRAENILGKTVVGGIGSDGTIERATPRTVWVGVRFAQ